MPKIIKKQKTPVEKHLLATMPWACTNFGQIAEIDAYMEETGTWETIAEIHGVSGADAEDVGNFIIDNVNRSKKVDAAAIKK